MSSLNPSVVILDVGHGNSTVLCDYPHCFVVDCGLGPSLIKFLRQEGLYEIESIFLSHADQDHIGGLIGLLSANEFKINHVYAIADATKETALWDGVLYSLNHSSLNGGAKLHISLSTSEGPFICGSIGLRVVTPTPYLAGKSAGGETRAGEKITSNSISASFHVEWNSSSVAYLAGDIDQVSLNQIEENDIKIESPVLVFPHHGGKAGGEDVAAFTKKLCELTKPSTVIMSIGRKKHGNPRPEVVATLRSQVPDVRIACTQLSVNCSDILPKTSPTHLLDLHSRGKSTRECCSGSFVIKLGTTIEYFPTKRAHRKFINDFVPTPLCI